jgi:predicted O-methyltransferase YrrM
MTTLLIPELIDKYSEQYTSDELPVLAALNRETNLKRGDSVMLSGHLQGALLQMLSQMIQPKNILEIGTYTGYSAICLAQGLREGGHLHTIEIDEELQDMSSRYFRQAGLENSITQHIGVAAEIIPSLNESFDLVFIDADKPNYELYYDLVIEKIPVGGYILADNVLYGGEVVLPEDEQSKNGNAIFHFNKKIKADSRVAHLLLPVRDGLMIMRKVKGA